MDLDKDGKVDVLGSSFKGTIAWAKNLGNGKIADPKPLKDTEGNQASHKMNSNTERQMYPIACDWDNDGDLDLVIGGFSGEVHLLKNTKGGTDDYDTTTEPLQAAGTKIQMEGHACPAFVDWDADGKKDLIVADKHGTIYLYKNIGSSSDPKLAKAKVLLNTKLHEAGPQSNLTLSVTDYNADGKLDLLVGGITSEPNAKAGIWLFPGTRHNGK